MVVGMAIFIFALAVAKQFESPVGDHLVGVHVRGRARSALNAVDGELVAHLARDDLVAGRADGLPDLAGQHVEVHVGDGGGLLHLRERPDELGETGDARTGNRKVFNGAQGLNAVIGIGGNFSFTQKVMFKTRHGRFSCLMRIPRVLFEYIEPAAGTGNCRFRIGP